MRCASLVAEKLPLLILAGVSSAVTVYAQRAGGAMMTETMLPFDVRAANAVVSYAKYLAIAFWPSGLAVYYPHPLKAASTMEVASAAAILVAVTVAVIAAARRHPHLLVGWFWFVGTLVPVIGLVQVGGQAMADRYTYVPFIGLFIAVAWGVHAILQTEARSSGKSLPPPLQRGDQGGFPSEPGAQATGGFFPIVAARVAATAILGALAVTTWAQTTYWHDSKKLFQHALDVVPNNTQAHIFMAQTLVREGLVAVAVPHFAEAVRIVPNEPYNLADYGRALYESGRIDEATPQLEQAVKLMPTHSGAQYFLGVVRGKQNRPKEAIAHLQEALRLDPKLLHAHYYIGSAYADQGQFVQAIQYLQKWLTVDPKSSETLVRLGQCYSALGNVDAARETLQKAVDANPKDAYALAALAQIVSWQGDVVTAIELYERALKIAPDYPRAANNLAMIYATADDAQFRNSARAVELAEHACRLTGFKDPVSLDTLAAAYAEAGRFDDAMKTISAAIEIARSAGETKLVQYLELRRALYSASRPLRPGDSSVKP
jgi:tetratricopeptide (TPR) repeat protein